MTKQEEVQQLTEQWLSIFAGLVRSGQLYSVDVQARLLLSKLNSKGVMIQCREYHKPDNDIEFAWLFTTEPLIEVKDD